MNQKDELLEHITSICQILIEVMDNFAYTKYLHAPDTQKELDYILKSNDLVYIRHVMWRMCIVDLAKLYSKSDNDKYRIEKLLSKLKPNGHYRSLNFSEDKIQNWEHEIKNKEILIKTVNELRNKIYAHTDNNKDKLKHEISFCETESLILLIKVIILTIFNVIFDSEVEIETLVFDKSRFNMIKILAEENENRINRDTEEFLAICNKSKDIK